MAGPKYETPSMLFALKVVYLRIELVLVVLLSWLSLIAALSMTVAVTVASP